MFANPLTLIILLLFLLFVCLSLLIWFALSLRNPSTPRQRTRDSVQVREGKHRAKPKTGAQTQPTVALRGSAALLEDAQTRARAQPTTNAPTPNTPPDKMQAEREARLEAIKAQRAYSAAGFVEKPVSDKPLGNEPRSDKPTDKGAPAPNAPTPRTAMSKEPELERAKRESPFPSPPRYDPQRQAVQADVPKPSAPKPSNPKLGNPEPSKRELNDPRIKDPRIKDPRIRDKGGTPVRVRPVASAPDIPTKPDVHKAPEQTQAEPKQKPTEKPKRKKPDAFEQFIRSKNDDFEL